MTQGHMFHVLDRLRCALHIPIHERPYRASAGKVQVYAEDLRDLLDAYAKNQSRQNSDPLDNLPRLPCG